MSESFDSVEEVGVLQIYGISCLFFFYYPEENRTMGIRNAMVHHGPTSSNGDRASVLAERDDFYASKVHRGVYEHRAVFD
jgi:hypothetical protein